MFLSLAVWLLRGAGMITKLGTTHRDGYDFYFENQIIILKFKIVIFNFDLKSFKLTDFDLKWIYSWMILILRRWKSKSYYSKGPTTRDDFVGTSYNL